MNGQSKNRVRTTKEKNSSVKGLTHTIPHIGLSEQKNWLQNKARTKREQKTKEKRNQSLEEVRKKTKIKRIKKQKKKV